VRLALARVGIVVCASCGDNSLPIGVDLVHARDLAIVAHSDDDLVYLQPDMLERTLREGATIAYLTDGRTDADRRHAGIMQAYTAATGVPDWQCGWIEIAGHAVEHCRLADARLSLVFFGYPEGDFGGTAPLSIAQLWDGTLPLAITIGDIPTSYTRDDAIQTLTALVDATSPRTVRTMDLAGVHGDHADHAITGAATLLAIAGSAGNPELISYRGDSTSDPATLIDPLFDRSAGLLAYYDACVEGSAECGEPAAAITEAHAIALRRRYAVGMRLAGGELRDSSGCVAADPDGSLSVVTCPGPERWELAADGTLHVGERCIETLLFNGELIAGIRCDPDVAHRFFLDDEGHLWSGAPPPFSSTGASGALLCVAVLGGRPRATPCGPDLAPVWELSVIPTVAVRPDNLPTGRAVRLADIDGDNLADLCAIVATKLQCAPGSGTGGFGNVVVLGTLPVEPESLVIGDVDGDGTADACGRDGAGLLCATAGGGFVAERWSPAFANGGPANATDRSLAAVDSDNNGSAEICGLSFAGIACAQHDLAALPSVRSTWPSSSAVVWPGDLDGDRRADWCAVSGSGVFCGSDALSRVTTDGVPWTYSLGGIQSQVPTDPAISALGDIDGDGRADLCGVFTIGASVRVGCARSQEFGFGPLAVLATLPTIAPTGLWLGDLDGNGAADVCVDDNLSIRCALSR
jgi:hypothetical protein